MVFVELITVQLCNKKNQQCNICHYVFLDSHDIHLTMYSSGVLHYCCGARQQRLVLNCYKRYKSFSAVVKVKVKIKEACAGLLGYTVYMYHLMHKT